jgi:hypothetical protein
VDGMKKVYLIFTLKDGNYGFGGSYSSKEKAREVKKKFIAEGHEVITHTSEVNVDYGRVLNNSYYGWDYKNNFELVKLKF